VTFEHEDLHLDTQHPNKKAGVATQPMTPVPAEKSTPGACWPARLEMYSGLSERRS